MRYYSGYFSKYVFIKRIQNQGEESLTMNLWRNREYEMEIILIEKLEKEIQELKKKDDDYIVRITLETYYHHLYKLYQRYNRKRL